MPTSELESKVKMSVEDIPARDTLALVLGDIHPLQVPLKETEILVTS